MQLNRKAWELLNPDEKTALGLQIGMDKSSWQAGEIMNKSHYKYLEIKYRAEYFLKMFTEHLDLFDEMVPTSLLTGDKTAIAFLKTCIEKRVKPMESIKILQEKAGERLTKSLINDKLIPLLRAWERSENPYEQTIFNLVKEFDRWNNFRILPKEIQEPSAYKRRIKNIHKKHIRMISSINTFSLDKLHKHYYDKKSTQYLALLYGGIPQLWPVKINSTSAKIFNTLGLYYFDKEEEGKEFITTIYNYVSKSKKECTDGLDFWPKYREMIKRAENYQEVQKISPSRKYLQLAMAKFEFL